jgi:hypothetical protein
VLDNGGLLSALVRKSEYRKDLESTAKTRITSAIPSRGLLQLDVLGDIHAFSLAGHEKPGNVK